MMTRRDCEFLLLGIFAVLCFHMLMRILFISRHQEPPRLAGQEVPTAMYKLDFGRRYNVTLGYRYGSQAELEYKDVKLLGVVGDSGTGGGFSSYSYFERWIALEQIDGRKLFLPLNSIQAMEEAEGP